MQGKGKSFRSFAQIPVDEISALAAAHAEIILKIKIKQLEQLEDSNQHELYFDIELPLVKVLADMEYYGFKIDADELKKYGEMLGLRIRTLEQEITMLAGEEFNINSPKQLGAVLFEKLNLPVLKKTKTGYSTDAEVLEQILHRHEIVPRIVEFRQLVKLKSTYADGLQKVINNKTAKIHSSFNQTVTVTGRISSTEPNLQNIPIRLDLGRRIRKVFIPSSEEFTFVDADYSQIELRVLAHITGDQAMIDAFVNNADIHTMTAAQVFDVPRMK